MPARTVTVYGATGYTGRLVAAEALRCGLPVRLAGRRRDALETLAADLGGDVEVALADAADAGALEAVAAATGVLVSTVGPYEDLGRPVVEAALAAGCHYLDVSGEASFVGWVHEQRERAARAGAVLCPAAGFDGAAGDVLVRLAANALGGAVHEVRTGYLVRGGRLSGGTLRSGVGIARRGSLALAAGQPRHEPLLSHTWTIPFPEPLGPVLGASVPAPEVLAVGRSVGAREARAYLALPGGAGPARAGSALGARLLGRAAPVLAGGRAAGPLRAVTGLLPAGPSPGRREHTRCALLAEVSGPDGTRRAWLRLRDIYGVTARLVAGLAERLLEVPTGEGGLRTPAQVVGPDPARFLTAIGARWEILPEDP